MANQTTYYGKLLRPELQGGRKVTVLVGKTGFKKKELVCTIGVPFCGLKKTSSLILGFCYGFVKKVLNRSAIQLQTSGVMHCSAVTMSAVAAFVSMPASMGRNMQFPKNIRVSRATGGLASGTSFWYRVIGW